MQYVKRSYFGKKSTHPLRRSSSLLGTIFFFCLFHFRSIEFALLENPKICRFAAACLAVFRAPRSGSAGRMLAPGTGGAFSVRAIPDKSYQLRKSPNDRSTGRSMHFCAALGYPWQHPMQPQRYEHKRAGEAE